MSMRAPAVAVAVALGFGGEAQIGPLADGCVVTMAAGCGSTTLGQLAPGDCTTSRGELADVIDFPASAGQEFVLTLRPLESTFTTPALTVRPPAGDASATPIVLGGQYGAVCEAPGLPVGCIAQELACNQNGAWQLDASACRFDDGRPYNQWAVWGVAGDDLRLTMTSTGFAPMFADSNVFLLKPDAPPRRRVVRH